MVINQEVSEDLFVNAGNDDELKELDGYDQAPIVVSSCSLLERFVGAQKTK